MKEKIKGCALPTASAVLFMLVYYYLALPAINIRSFGFWAMIALAAVVFIGCYCIVNKTEFFREISIWIKESAKAEQAKKQNGPNGDYYVPKPKINLPKWVKITGIVISSVLALVLILTLVTSSKLFRAKKYQQMLSVNPSDFAEDIAEMPISQIPIVDRDTAERLGKRKIGEVVELVSQFNVSDYYSQINYNNKPYRVSPLEYAGLLKWFSNKENGIPYYVSINMATQDTELVKLSEGMKYSPSEYFSRDLNRHIRFAYPTKMFENLSFEVDDDGNPYWVMSYYTYTIGLFGGKDIEGVILVNAVTGEMTDYPISQVPQWIDLAYSPELVVEQANNWGTYKNGFLNSIFVQKDVVVTTDGYNYIAVDDDVWLYTGITSVSADESNIGFILVNMRTKEAKTYMINGAEEYSAMESAQGQIQDKKYAATFPILINVADRPTYFISLKDDAGLVKSFAFVSVTDYQIVGVADSIEDAEREYRRKLGISSSENAGSAASEFSGVIEKIAEAVKDGNSVYYIKLMGNDIVFKADISVSDMLPLLSIGEEIILKADESFNVKEINYSSEE